MDLDRHEVEKFTEAYFQSIFELTPENVCPTPIDQRGIYLNKLAVIKFMQTIWDGVQKVHEKEIDFVDVMGVITTYYDINYPYMGPLGRKCFRGRNCRGLFSFRKRNRSYRVCC